MSHLLYVYGTYKHIDAVHSLIISSQEVVLTFHHSTYKYTQLLVCIYTYGTAFFLNTKLKISWLFHQNKYCLYGTWVYLSYITWPDIRHQDDVNIVCWPPWWMKYWNSSSADPHEMGVFVIHYMARHIDSRNIIFRNVLCAKSLCWKIVRAISIWSIWPTEHKVLTSWLEWMIFFK
jgi:hypothetical protein